MEYLVPLLIVLVIVIAVVVGARVLGRRNKPADGQAGGSTGGGSRRGREATREDAAEASTRLSPEEHRSIYSMIAQNQVLNAVKEYRKATRMGLGESAAAVAALAQFPQPTPEAAKTSAADVPLTVADIIKAAPEAPVVEPQADEAPAVESAVESAVPGQVLPEPQLIPPAAGKYRYRAIVARGEEVREVASTRLNEEIFGQIRGLALAGDFDAAARLLCDHADIGSAEAREFVSMIGPED